MSAIEPKPRTSLLEDLAEYLKLKQEELHANNEAAFATAQVAKFREEHNRLNHVLTAIEGGPCIWKGRGAIECELRVIRQNTADPLAELGYENTER